ncbi:MAG: glycosyl hydrolase [Verrucomicrobiota bacterium]
MKNCRRILRLTVLTLFTAQATLMGAGELSFSDPANVPPPPPGAVGFADRSPTFDALSGFQNPPPGFGTVPFYWWLGDPLTKERLGWELEQMKGMGVSGFQINYAHTDKGGRSYGLTYPSDPALFSDDWWRLTGWFMQEAKQRGAGISLSDYTLGFGQGWCADEILREHPEVMGMRLVMGKDGKVTSETVPWSLNPMHPMSGKWYAEKFFGQFEKRFPGEGGKGLNFFFSDELQFGVRGRLWSKEFAAEFQKRKGYDITPELPALFKDIGPRTPKIRLDYSDVLVALSEEGFFKPVFDWHQQRGMIMGCDHGGRGKDVVEFGDYFRTQRWNQGPGADQPGLGRDLVKAKVAASIAHLYERPRVWLEGFYGSGWGTSSAGFVDATFYDYVMGYNLLGIHGMYYSTHGGWWEWAAPDNTFRMPYWPHLRGFFDCLQRLGYLLSQGHHACDVAILYPVAAKEAGLDGDAAVKAAFDTAGTLYSTGIDFDFMDFESLARAQAKESRLQVSGESYRALVIPSMKAVRFSTLQKAVEFQRAGGLVILLGALPEASDRIGRNDPELDALVAELKSRVASPAQVRELVEKSFPRDYTGPGIVQHRKVGPRDLYAIYNAPKDAEVTLRATNKVELWNPWDGTSRPLEIISQSGGATKLKLPLNATEVQLIVFSPGEPVQAKSEIRNPKYEIMVGDDWEFELQPTLDNRFGDFHWPPAPTKIGAEIRQLWYCEGDNTNAAWRKVTCSFGPQFTQSTNFPATAGGQPYEFSWRWGIQNDPGHQGYHGLKAEVHDDFLAIGKAKTNPKHMPNVVSYEANGDTFFSTTVVAPRDMDGFVFTGTVKPAKVWLNGQAATNTTLKLKPGANQLVLQYNKPGRTYFVVSTSPDAPPKPDETLTASGQPKFRSDDLAMTWWTNVNVLPFDVRATEAKPVGWYRFQSPPGLRGFTLKAHGKVQAWVNGVALTGETKFVVPTPSAKPVIVLLRVEHERGRYDGAAFDEPIQLDCGAGEIALGDWSKNEGLTCYSGGAWYRKTVKLPAAKSVTLDLGNLVSSAEVRVNGKSVGICVAPPWTFDISNFAQPGDNRIEIQVRSTLANHYLTIPTQYRGSTVAGLLGPVRLIVEPAKAK